MKTMSKKQLALYSLKYNPFCQEVPTSSLFVYPAIESFCWRIENQIGEGGFALVTGMPGSGKSVALRILAERLGAMPDVTVGELTRPQASVADLYRELGDLFAVTLTPSNRWGGAKALRQKWLAHIDASLYRPVLLVDEAQLMSPAALCELRLLASAELDSRSILTVVLAGDERLAKKLHTDDLLPMASRIRCRLRCEPAEPQQLRECLRNHLKKAGNPRLISEPVVNALCEHAAGNYRSLMNMANDLLAAALQRQADQIDEKLFFEVFDIRAASTQRSKS
jgi:type II secretory pathway predicted ATPase ExeA